MTRTRCTSAFSIAWMLLALAGCGVAVAQDTGVLEPAGSGLVDILWLLDRYGPWGAIMAVGWRALGIIDRLLTKGIDAGQAALEAFTATGVVLSNHVDRLLTAAENGTLRVVVDHRHNGEAPLNVDADRGAGRIPRS